MKNWNNMTWEEKNSIFRQITETYSGYAEAETFAYNVRMGYENDPEWFGFEVTDLDQFENELAEIFNEQNKEEERIEVDFDKMRVYAYGFGYVNQRDADVEEAMQEELDSKCPNRYEVGQADYFQEEDCWSAKFVEQPIETMQELADYINGCEDWPTDVEAIIEQNGWVSDTGVDSGICHSENEICYINDKGEAVTATGKAIDNIEARKSGLGYDLTYTVYGLPVCVTGEFFVDKQGYLHHEDAITGEDVKVKVINTKTFYYICMVVGDKQTYVATTDDIDNDGFVDADRENFSFKTREEAEKTKAFFEDYAKHRGYDNVRFIIEEIED